MFPVGLKVLGDGLSGQLLFSSVDLLLILNIIRHHVVRNIDNLVFLIVFLQQIVLLAGSVPIVVEIIEDLFFILFFIVRFIFLYHYFFIFFYSLF